jgi:hypothetical protein
MYDEYDVRRRGSASSISNFDATAAAAAANST